TVKQQAAFLPLSSTACRDTLASADSQPWTSPLLEVVMSASPSRRCRLACAAFALLVMVAVAALRLQSEPLEHTFRVTLGLLDKEPSDWSGRVTVAEGEAISLAGWRFEEKDNVDGTTAWQCRTHEYIVPDKRYPLQPAPGQPKPPEPPREPWPNGVTLTVRGEKPAVTLTLSKGEVKFQAAELRLGEPKTFLDGQVRVERLPATQVLRGPAPANAVDPVQDDYP